MTTAITSATELLATAAVSIAGTLASAEPLTVGEAVGDASSIETAMAGGLAVVVPFTGALSGDLVLIVDTELTTALHESSIGQLDVAAALQPALDAAATAIGPLTLGNAQQMDVRLALHRAFAHPDAAAVPMHGASTVRAAAAIGVAGTAQPDEVRTEPPAAERLDLLRGVEMDATAELGRTRMTVNDLLSLRTGTVIELDRAAGAPADLFVNGRLIARGEVVVIDENYGLRITQVVTDDATR